MKILIDIGHPAHVHYFKNLITVLKKKGNQIIVTARTKEVSFELLDAYQIPYFSRGKGENNLFGKIIYLIIGTFYVCKIAKKHKIDLFLSFASPYTALASIFYRKPNIALDDTEHNFLNHNIYVPLSKAILTPESYNLNYKTKQVRFAGTMESAYLHRKYFSQKNKNSSNMDDDRYNKKNVLIRIVSWNASHDINQNGISQTNLKHLIDSISPYAYIHISSEKKLPPDLEDHIIHIKAEDIHHYMLNMDLVIGESGTMATEAAYLGTYSIVLNSASDQLGVFHWFSQFDSFYIAKDYDDLFVTALNYLKNDELTINRSEVSETMHNESICLTDFLSWFIENYPQSHQIMKDNPDYQYNFK